MQAEVHELRAVLKVLVSNVWLLDTANVQGFVQFFPFFAARNRFRSNGLGVRFDFYIDQFVLQQSRRFAYW